MPQPVKLSDPLIDAARQAAGLAHRSLAAQIEHWATLGRAIEGKLTIEQSSSLKHAVREPAPPRFHEPHEQNQAIARALANALTSTARQDLARELAQSPAPLYSTDPAFPGTILRENPDGTRTPGNWRDGRFVALETDPDHSTAAAAR